MLFTCKTHFTISVHFSLFIKLPVGLDLFAICISLSIYSVKPTFDVSMFDTTVQCHYCTWNSHNKKNIRNRIAYSRKIYNDNKKKIYLEWDSNSWPCTHWAENVSTEPARINIFITCNWAKMINCDGLKFDCVHKMWRHCQDIPVGLYIIYMFVCLLSHWHL